MDDPQGGPPPSDSRLDLPHESTLQFDDNAAVNESGLSGNIDPNFSTLPPLPDYTEHDSPPQEPVLQAGDDEANTASHTGHDDSNTSTLPPLPDISEHYDLPREESALQPSDKPDLPQEESALQPSHKQGNATGVPGHDDSNAVSLLHDSSLVHSSVPDVDLPELSHIDAPNAKRDPPTAASMSLREESNAIDQLSRENFGLKLIIHGLRQKLDGHAEVPKWQELINGIQNNRKIHKDLRDAQKLAEQRHIALKELKAKAQEQRDALEDELQRMTKECQGMREEHREEEEIWRTEIHEATQRIRILEDARANPESQDDAHLELGYYRRRIESLEDNLFDTKNEVQRLTYEIESSEDAIAFLRKEQRGDRDTIALLREEQRDDKGEIAFLRKEQQDDRDEIALLHEAQRGDKEAIALLREAQRNDKINISDLESEVKMYRMGLEAEQDKVSDLEELLAEIPRLTDQIETNHHQITSLRDERDGDKIRISDLESEVKMYKAYKARFHSEQERTRDLEQLLEDERQQQGILEGQEVQRLTDQLKASQDQFAALQEEQERDKVKIRNFESEVSMHKTGLHREEEKSRDLEQHLKDERHKHEIAENEAKQKAKRKMNELNRRALAASEEARRLREKLSSQDTEAGSWRERYMDLENNLRETLGDLTGDRSDLISNVTKLQKELESSALELKTTRSKLSQKVSQLRNREALVESHRLESRKLTELLDGERHARRADRQAYEQSLKNHPDMNRLRRENRSMSSGLHSPPRNTGSPSTTAVGSGTAPSPSQSPRGSKGEDESSSLVRRHSAIEKPANADRSGQGLTRSVTGTRMSSETTLASNGPWMYRIRELEKRLKAEREGRLIDRRGARERLAERDAEIQRLQNELNRLRIAKGLSSRQSRPASERQPGDDSHGASSSDDGLLVDIEV